MSAEYESQDFYVGNRHIHISELQNALQVPASVYGLLIITSVSAIALQRIRYELAELEGVALGYLLAGYQLNHLPRLLSKAFWTGFYARTWGGQAYSICLFSHYLAFASLWRTLANLWGNVDHTKACLVEGSPLR
jgi:hypothetical protein